VGATANSGPSGTTVTCTGGALNAAPTATTATAIFTVFIDAAFDDSGPSSWSATLSPITTTTPASGTIAPTGATQTIASNAIVPEAIPFAGLAPTSQTVFVGNRITQIVTLDTDSTLSDAVGVVVKVTPPAVGGVPLAVV